MIRLAIFFLVLAISGASAFGGTQESLFGGTRQSFDRTIEIELRAAAAPEDTREFLESIIRVGERVLDPKSSPGLSINWSQSNDAQKLLGGQSQRSFAVKLLRFEGKSATVFLRRFDDDGQVFLEKLVARLKEIAASAPRDLPADQIKLQIAAIDSAMAKRDAQEQKLWQLMASRQKSMEDLQAEKMRALELEKQRIEIDLTAKDARAAAVREQIRAIDRQTTTRTADDPVTKELREAVNLREAAVKMLQARYENGQVGFSEVNDAKTALADARTKLVEREEALKQSVNGELLSRLSQDLVVAAIDQSELKARLAAVKRLLPPDDFSQLTEEELNRLSAAYTTKAIGVESPALSERLTKEAHELREKRLGMQIQGVTVVAPATTRGVNPTAK
jgi:hypothetical protein